MNTVQLSQRMGRNLIADDPTMLPAEQSLDVLAAMSAGIETFYLLAPDRMKRTPVSVTIRPPVDLSVTFAAQYSNQLSSGTFDPALFGCTVLLNGVFNEVANTSATLDDWLSGTLAATGTGFYDAIQLPLLIERAASAVRLYGLTGQLLGALTRDDGLTQRQRRIAGLSAGIGRPRYYAVENTGIARGSGTVALLRIKPLPEDTYVVRFDAQLAPSQITFDQLTNPVSVPVPDEYINSILVPLCEAELTTSQYWRDKSTIPGTLRKADQVKAERLSRIPADIGVPANVCGTPRGF